MTCKNNMLRKLLSFVLCVLVVLSCFTLLLRVSASAQGEDTRVVDPSTMDDWKDFFLRDNTENSGAIWTDKSVFTDESAFDSSLVMENSADNFLVSLSAVSAQTKIKGYSYLPTDTIFVLDVSRSMGRNSLAGDNNRDVADELVDSVNAAVNELLEINKNNRVGVVLYSGNVNAEGNSDDKSAQVLLPLGRYEEADSRYLVKELTNLEVGTETVHADVIKVNGTVTSDGEVVAENKKIVDGGSFVQSGLHTAMNEFLSVEDTEIGDGGFQDGTKRTPVIVLLNDGIPTFASSDYTNAGVSDMGNGDTPEDELESAIPFVTQLTASYTKERVEEHYGKEAKFYTVGYSDSDVSVVAPSQSQLTDAHWQTYHATSEDGVMQLAVKRTWINSGWYGTGHWDTEYKTVYISGYDLDENYADKHFLADDELTAAFEGAVNEIVAKSLYYPTSVESGNTDLDGYIEFIDDIGQYMEVKKIHGILLGDYLFSGNNIAKNFIGTGGALGTIEKPSNLGDEMIRAVKARLGIKETADAQKLVDDAYRAGQLSYNPETGEYSNYIGWYADKDGKFISHGTREDSQYPENAEFYNESYGYLGEVIDGHNTSDMMYVSVQIHTRISTGTSAVIFRVPASLIPVINYEVTLTGESMEEEGDVTFKIDSEMDVDTNDDGVADKTVPVSPIRLIFEVGLSQGINELNVSEIVGSDYKHKKDGEYTFYTNRWDEADLNHEHPSVAKNTVAFYEPSTENERYYYTKNDKIYKKSGEDYIPFTSEENPADFGEPLYREFAVFESVNDESHNNGRMHLHYTEIAPEILKKAQQTADSGWYIPKGTIHRLFDSFHSGKGGFADDTQMQVNENNTGTIKYSHYFSVEQTPDLKGYYADVVLGNNGKMTLKQAQGLKIQADTDLTMLGREDVFEFAVKAENEENAQGEYRLIIIDSQGETNEEKVSFTEGELIVRIKASQSAYLVDLPEGENFTVTEHITENDFEISVVNGENKKDFTFTVEKNSLVKAEFVHSLLCDENSGAVVLYNTIEHPFAEDFVVPENIEFTYEVEYKDKNSQPHKEEIVLKPFETKHIKDILLGEEVKISLKGIPAGFTSDKENDTAFVRVDAPQYYITEFSNKYAPEDVSPKISLTGTKKLYGRQDGQWLESDKFTFELRKFADGKWDQMTLAAEDEVKGAQAVVTDASRSYDLSEFMCAEVYGDTGVYSYRVSEVFEEETSQGITYDKGVRWFDISVTDKDMDGFLEVDSIKPYGGTLVSRNDDESWKITADFTNNYRIAGSDTVTIILNNKVIASNGSDKDVPVKVSGFEYGLYQNDRLITIFPLTTETGETLLTLTYGDFDIGKHIHYVVKQMPHEEYEENMVYSEQDYHIAVSVYDDNTGGVRAAITAQEHDEEAPLLTGKEVTLQFENVYNVKTENTDPTEPTGPDATEPDITAPEVTDPIPSESETASTAPTSQDPTSSTNKGNPTVTPSFPNTGLIGTMNNVLWVFAGIVVLLALICMIFVGKKK